MVDGIVMVCVVLAAFALFASLLTLYAWRVDPHQFAVSKAERLLLFQSRRSGARLTAR